MRTKYHVLLTFLFAIIVSCTYAQKVDFKKTSYEGIKKIENYQCFRNK